MYFANTHLHSDLSDGLWSPEKLVELGQQIGHKAMLLTDHDTIAGYHRFNQACRKAGMLTMIATEPSVTTSFGRMHLVLIDFNPEDKEMRAYLARQSSRMRDYTWTCFKEAEEKGLLRPGITWQDVENAYPDVTYLCNHWVFRLMVEKGIYTQEEIETIVQPLFTRDKKTQLEIKARNGILLEPAEEVIQICLNAGGVPIIAHPTKTASYFFEEETEKYVKMGVMGFEVNHPIMSEEEKAFYTRVCDEHNLYKLGGIDHSGLLGGYSEADPKDGYIDEENFMKLYKRELG